MLGNAAAMRKGGYGLFEELNLKSDFCFFRQSVFKRNVGVGEGELQKKGGEN